jgi:hypothetical protein
MHLPPPSKSLKMHTFLGIMSLHVNYLGSILNADNKMNIEIAERIAKGNKSTLC